MDDRRLARIIPNRPQHTPTTSGALTDSRLAELAQASPAAAYVRSLTSDPGRSSTAQAISLAADHLAPGVLPPSKGRGRGGNGAERFATACGLPWHDLRTDRLGELRASLVRSGAAAATTNKVLAAVRGVLHHAWQQGLLDGDALARAKAALKSVRGSTIPKGRHIAKGEIARLFMEVSRKPNPAAARDAAVLALMCIGLRRAEIAALRTGDYQSDSGRLLVRGKGGKERVVFLTNGAKAAVDDWIAIRGQPGTDALLLAVSKSGIVQAAGITPQSVYAALLKRAAEAGVTMTPHDFRRTFIGEALSAGIDVVTVQRLAGHSSPATTSRYDRRSEDVARTAMAAVAVPYLRSAS